MSPMIPNPPPPIATGPPNPPPLPRRSSTCDGSSLVFSLKAISRPPFVLVVLLVGAGPRSLAGRKASFGPACVTRAPALRRSRSKQQREIGRLDISGRKREGERTEA